ncbi:hepatic lectin-like [Leptodactylus fuscus]|uniref:hepatic lectin-like n=1 Tax=Leptodactylus fuscus TaxID=238119 RepID=UPI003F4E6838
MPEPWVSQVEEPMGEVSNLQKISQLVISAGENKRDCQGRVSEPIPQVPEVLSVNLGDASGQKDGPERGRGGQVCRKQIMSLRNVSTQNGVGESFSEPGAVPAPEPVLGEKTGVFIVSNSFLKMDSENNISREILYETLHERHPGRSRFYSFTPKTEWIPYGLLALLYVLILALFITVFSGANVSSKQFLSLKEMNDFRGKVKNLSSNMDDLHMSVKKKTCEAGWKKFDTSCYYLTIVKDEWSKTRSTCLAKEADLAVVTSDREQIFLSSYSGASSSKWYWIGLHDMEDEGTWIWVDGTNFETSYKHWKKGEPNNYQDNEHCGHFWSSGEWNDAPCDSEAYGICEKKL